MLNFSEIKLLQSDVKLWLQGIFPFKDLHVIELTETGMDVPNALHVQQRQLARAEEKLKTNECFIDRVSHTLFIPFMALLNEPITAIALTGVNRLISLEEVDRWGAALKASIEEKIKSIATETRLAPSKEIPGYLKRYLSQTPSKVFGILHLTTSYNDLFLALMSSQEKKGKQVLTEKLPQLPRSWEIKWLGGNETELWLLIPDVDEREFHLTTKKIINDSVQKTSLVKRCVSHLFNTNNLSTNQILERISNTETIAQLLGTNIFSQQSLETLQQKLDLQDILAVLSTLDRMFLTKKHQAFLLLQSQQPLNIETISEDFGFNRDVECAVLDENLLLLSEIFTSPNRPHSLSEWANDTANTLIKQQNVFLAGVCATWQKGYAGVASVLFALLHAKFLHNPHSNTIIAFDDITLNVMADEFYAWGDLKGALKLYTEAYKQKKTSQTLLNSLGATLAECGEKAKAMTVFKEATLSFPNDFEGYYNLGGILIDKKRYDEAQECLEKALTLVPDDLRVKLRHLTLLEKTKQDHAALTFAEGLVTDSKISEKVPGSTFRLLASLRWKAGMSWGEIKWALEEAVRRSPVDIEALLLLSKGYLSFEQDTKTAGMFFEKAANLLSSGSNTSRSTKENFQKLATSLKYKGKDTL